MCLLQDEDTSLSLEELVREPHGIATVAFEIISTLGILPFIYIEICTMMEYTLWGWLDFWCVACPLLPTKLLWYSWYSLHGLEMQ